MIELGNVTKRFASRGGMITVLEHINLTISSGEWVTIFGDERSGKTTLLKCLNGIVRPDSGQINVNGMQLTGLTRDLLKKFRQECIGYISRDAELLPQFSVLDNVILPFIPYMRRSVIKERAEYLLERLGIIYRRGHLPNRLNDDEKRRAAIARALLNQPSVLLLDEPMEGLEPTSKQRIFEIIEELHAGKHTIVSVTKDPEVSRQGDRTYFLHGGKLKEAVLT